MNFQTQTALTLDAQNLFQSMQYLNQIVLIGHHDINVFISSWNFIYYAFVFTTDHALSLLHQIGGGELMLGGGPAHFSARTVGARIKLSGLPLPRTM